MANGAVEMIEAVDRRLVHRVSMSEVYLVESRALGEGLFSVHAQWPRRHFFFSPERPGGDLLLAAETLRQAVILVAHRYYDVPFDHALLMRGLSIELTGAGGGHAGVPAEVEIRVEVGSVRSGSRGITAFQAQLTFLTGEEVIARGTGDLQILERLLYRRLRPSAIRSDALDGKSALSRTLPRGVSLEPDQDPLRPTWRLDIDLQHPVFFDHPLDHVPGMLIIEAAQQAADRIRASSSAGPHPSAGHSCRFSISTARYT